MWRSVSKLAGVAGGLGAAASLTYAACEPASASATAPSTASNSKPAWLNGPNVMMAVWVGGSVGICGMLALSARTARRADRALTAIHAAEQVLMRSREVRASVGPVFSGGSFQISSEGSGPAAGWYSCTLSGGVRGKVYLEAVPDAASQDKWRVTSLRLELPKAQLAARDAARRSVAEAAGYHGASTASASAGAEAGADSAAAATATAAPAAAAAATAPASGEPAEDELLVWQVVGESQDAASAPAAATR